MQETGSCTLPVYRNVITFILKDALTWCILTTFLTLFEEGLCASTTTSSTDSLAICCHGVHVVINESLQSLLDSVHPIFHNRYPFFFLLILGLLLAPFHFSTTSTGGWSNYLPISMWLFTLIAFAIITATTASAITVVIIIFSFLCFLWSRRVSVSCFTLSCNNLSYLKPSVPIAQNLLFLLFECKGNAFFLNIGNNGMTK